MSPKPPTEEEQSIHVEIQSQLELEKAAKETVITGLYEWARFEDTGEIIRNGVIVDELGHKPILNMLINGTDEQKEFIAELIRDKNEEIQGAFEGAGLGGSTLVVTRSKDEREPDSELEVFGVMISPLGDIVAVVSDPAIEPSAPKHKMTCFSKPEDCEVRFK